MSRFKKIILLLFSISAFAYIAFPLFYQARIFIIKLEARNRLRRNSLQTLSVNKSEVKWIEEGKELLVDGRLFDVEEYEFNKDELTVKGLFDDEETMLHNKLEKLCVHHQSKRQTLLLKYFQFVPYSCFHPNSYQINSLSQLLQKFIERSSFHRDDVFIKIPSPPPQV